MRNLSSMNFSMLAASLLAPFAASQLFMRDNSSVYTNPILNGEGADPWVIRYEDYYYMTFTNGANITIYRSNTLTNWNSADQKAVFVPPENEAYSTDLWAPELHNIDNKWYIIFTATPDNDNPSPEQEMYCYYNCPAVNHRMFVLESSGSDPWTSTYSYKSMLDTYDQFAIDGTYFQHASGLYHIYSCWYTQWSSWPSNLCITKMTNPYTVSSNFSERQIISTPDQPWEKTPYGRQDGYRLSSNEGPEQLTNPSTGQTFVIYSAARSDNRNYCLGQLELKGGINGTGNPMNPQDWVKTTSGCIFYQNPTEDAYGVGHASFTTSGSGTDLENWIVYHGMRDPTHGWSDRTIRTQKFTFGESGAPLFPRPGYGPYDAPSSLSRRAVKAFDKEI